MALTTRIAAARIISSYSTGGANAHQYRQSNRLHGSLVRTNLPPNCITIGLSGLMVVTSRLADRQTCRNVLNADGRLAETGADITLSGRLFQMVGPATGKARPPTVDSFTDGISRRLVRAERRERRPGRSATRTQV